MTLNAPHTNLIRQCAGCFALAHNEIWYAFEYRINNATHALCDVCLENEYQKLRELRFARICS